MSRVVNDTMMKMRCVLVEGIVLEGFVGQICQVHFTKNSQKMKGSHILSFNKLDRNISSKLN